MKTTHNKGDLKQMQSVPLEGKIVMTQERIRQWYDYWEGNVYVSFSGGKDSTVLKHIVDGMYDDVPSVFVNTGLEYPEIQQFVREVKAGKYACFTSDVEIIRPEMRFDEVIKRYGYPVISKEVAQRIYEWNNSNRTTYLQMRWQGKNSDGTDKSPRFNISKWIPLRDSGIPVSYKCCDVMKKNPVKKYEKKTGRKPILAVMAEESKLREDAWIKNGCNAFESSRPKSNPMSFWTEQDVLHYIKKYNVPYCPVYGEIKVKPHGDIAGQIDMVEDILQTTGCTRTGCMFCMFGCHLEKEPNRFQRMKQTHPKQYEYCMNQLGLKEVLEYIGVPYE